MIVPTLLAASLMQAGPIESQSAKPESYLQYEEDKKAFVAILKDNDVDRAIEFFREKADLCEETYRNLTCQFYWSDIQHLAGEFQMPKLLDYANERYVRSLEIVKKPPPGQDTERAVDLPAALKNTFDTSQYSNPGKAGQAVAMLVKTLPRGDPRWPEWFLEFSSFYDRQGEPERALLISKEVVSVIREYHDGKHDKLYLALYSTGRLLVESGEPETAIDFLQAAREEVRDDFYRFLVLVSLGEAYYGIDDRASARGALLEAGRLAERNGQGEDWQYVCQRTVKTSADPALGRATSRRASAILQERLASFTSFGPATQAMVRSGRIGQLCLVRSNWLLFRQSQNDR